MEKKYSLLLLNIMLTLPVGETLPVLSTYMFFKGHQPMVSILILIGAAVLMLLVCGTQLSTTTALGRMQNPFPSIVTIQLNICEIILGYTQSYCGISTIATQEIYTAERDSLMVRVFCSKN